MHGIDPVYSMIITIARQVADAHFDEGGVCELPLLCYKLTTLSRPLASLAALRAW